MPARYTSDVENLSHFPHYAMILSILASGLLAVASGVLAFRQPIRQNRRLLRYLIYLCVICITNAVFFGLRESGLLRSKLLLSIYMSAFLIACIWFHFYNKRQK